MYTYLYTNAQDLQTVEPRYSKPRNGHNTTPLTNDRMIFLLCESFRRDRASSTFRSRVENGKQMEIVDTPKKSLGSHDKTCFNEKTIIDDLCSQKPSSVCLDNYKMNIGF